MDAKSSKKWQTFQNHLHLGCAKAQIRLSEHSRTPEFNSEAIDASKTLSNIKKNIQKARENNSNTFQKPLGDLCGMVGTEVPMVPMVGTDGAMGWDHVV